MASSQRHEVLIVGGGSAGISVAARLHWDVVPAPPQFIPKSGVLWHPTEASEAIGRKVMRMCAEHLAKALRTEFEL